jgi:hypothetical protein
VRQAAEPARLRALRVLNVGYLAALVAMLAAAAVVLVIWQVRVSVRPHRVKRRS